MQYRFLAKEHLKKATSLLATHDVDQLPYACLELRKCIEALSYELLTGYLAEASMKVIETWQPDKVMKELVRIDPGAERNSFLRMRREGTDGGPSGDWMNLGEDRRPKAAWVTKSYHQLGSFLHVQTIKQQREGVAFDAATCRDRAVQIAEELARILEASIWNANFAVSVTFDCAECEAPIKRRSEVLETGGVIECGHCGQLYDAEVGGNGSYLFVPHSFSWDCDGCGTKREIAQSKARDGLDVSCQCGGRTTLKRQIQWTLEKIG
ncbi:hypothetical protein IVB38_29105 [Bradyrhizobium sp. 38]|uniref:hypothetical protein n=1 Tax=unclassified Bradyrhizobium TaxID=2631580 RepID=UPI001FFBF669|nr:MULTISPECIES: hypothetical protein [unclassified Bradyrhizobium]MCK1339953.1 hypothetical protein [Bradyrhizobium sp. 38]MCK1782189.1 hypothetical protein [Bradyrhizobium sp. 132]